MKYILPIMLVCFSSFYVEASNAYGQPQGSGGDEEQAPPRIIGTELMEMFRRPELTLKEAKRFYDETNQETVGTFTISSITDREAKSFCDTNRKEIMETSRKLIYRDVFLEHLENSVAALWFLLQCENIRSMSFQDEEKKSVAQLISELIDTSKHQATLLRWVKLTEKNPSPQIREKALRAARLLALFSADEATQKAGAEKYKALTNGTGELSLDCYAKNYPGNHGEKSSERSRASNPVAQPNSDEESLSEDDRNQEDVTPMPKKSRGKSVLRKLLLWGGAALGVAALVVAGAFAYKKYGTKNKAGQTPQPAR